MQASFRKQADLLSNMRMFQFIHNIDLFILMLFILRPVETSTKIMLPVQQIVYLA